MSSLSRAAMAAIFSIGQNLFGLNPTHPWAPSSNRRRIPPKDTHNTPSPKRAKVKAARKQRSKSK